MTPLLESRDLRWERDGRTILDVPSFALPKGDVTAVIGPNGAGKSTFIKALAGLLDDAGGCLYRAGVPVGRGDLVSYRRRNAVVFQEPLLLQGTVAYNVGAGLALRGMDDDRMRDAVQQQLALFGIGHLASRPGWTLSGGEAQRTSLARAFAVDPEVLFLDEPFAALDPPTREALIDDLGVVLRTRGTTAVIATHDRTEAVRLADRLAVMDGGRVVQHDTVDAVLNRPASESVAAFVGVGNMLGGQVLKSEKGMVIVGIAGGRLIEATGDMRTGTEVFACIRPEQVGLSRDSGRHAGSVRNELRGKVCEISPRGHYYQVVVDCGMAVTVFVTAHAIQELGLDHGVDVYASFKATAVHLLRRYGLPGPRP